MADIFLSYKKEDRTRIEALAAALQSEGFSTWFDYQIETGGDWFDQILIEIDKASCVLGCWTDNAVRDGRFVRSSESQLSYVLTEQRRAGLRLLPILCDAGAIPIEFGQLQAEDLTHWQGDRTDAVWQKLIARIDMQVGQAAPGWVHRRIATSEAALLAEQARREGAEIRTKALNEQLRVEARRADEIGRNLVAVTEKAQALQSGMEGLSNELTGSRTENIELKARVRALLADVSEFEMARRETQALIVDRARLASDLDAARARERELQKLADEASEALGAAISEVREALGKVPDTSTTKPVPTPAATKSGVTSAAAKV